MNVYRELHTDLDVERGKPFVFIPVDVSIVRSTCGRFGPVVWGRVEWGALHRTYFVIACRWFAVWF